LLKKRIEPDLDNLLKKREEFLTGRGAVGERKGEK